MTDYIKREDVERNLFKIPVKVDEDGYSWILLRNAFQASMDAPSAVVERKHGKWIEDGYEDEPYVCSECGEPCTRFCMEKPRWKYCPWCGAKMEVEE